MKEHIEISKNSQVKISSWKDEVTGERLPNKNYISRDLAGVTVYVPDSNTATVTMDGKSIFDFSRNPKDSTGRESITFLDLSMLHIINDIIWPKTFNNANGEALIKTESEAPGSGTFLELRPQNLKTPAMLSIPVQGINRDQHAETNFSFWARTDLTKAELSVSYVLENGEKFDVAIGPKATPSIGNFLSSFKTPTWQLNWGKANQWRRYIVSFSSADFKNTPAIPPRGQVKEIQLTVRNANKVDIAQIAFGRDNPFPKLNKGNILLGRISSLEDGLLVKAHFKNQPDREVETHHTGYFLFTDIPENTVVTGLDVYSKTKDQHVSYNEPIQLQSSIVGLTVPVAPGNFSKCIPAIIQK